MIVMRFASEDVTFGKTFSPEYYFLAALSLFIYQTMDACDGKQARRTGSSSPLGQLFDHGCDAVSMVCCCYIALQSLQAGSGYFYFMYIWVCFGGFFVFNWEEHFMGVLQTNFMGFGVTELVCMEYALIALHGYNGICAVTVREFGARWFPSLSE